MKLEFVNFETTAAGTTEPLRFTISKKARLHAVAGRFVETDSNIQQVLVTITRAGINTLTIASPPVQGLESALFYGGIGMSPIEAAQLQTIDPVTGVASYTPLGNLVFGLPAIWFPIGTSFALGGEQNWTLQSGVMVFEYDIGK